MLYIYKFFENNLWIIQVVSTILLTTFAHRIVIKVLKQLISRVKKTKVIYDEAIITALKIPVIVLVWLVGLSIALELIFFRYNIDSVTQYLSQIKSIGIAFIISWGIIRFIHNFEKLYIRYCIGQSKQIDKTFIHAVSKLSTITTLIVALLVIMQIFGLPISGLLAFGGISGAAIGFASKDLLANFFGGMIIYMDRPFKVGDWIRSPDKEIEGVVEFIGWRITQIRTFDKRPLYVPNGVFLTISVENPSRMQNRRIYTKVAIRYQDADKMDVITSQVRCMLVEHPEIDTNQVTVVNFVEFAASSLNFMVYAFTKTTNWVNYNKIKHDIFLKIIQIIEANQAQCALPGHDLYMQNGQAIFSKLDQSEARIN